MLRVVSISIFFHLWEFLVLFPPLLLIRSFPLLSFSYPTHLLDPCLFIYLFSVNLPLALCLSRGVHYCRVSIPPPFYCLKL